MFIFNDCQIQFGNDDVKSIQTIPAGNWLVKYDDFRGEYFLERYSAFSLPSHLYGGIEAQCDRYLNSWEKLGGNMGIMLCGLKGAGKSLLSKLICLRSALPVLIIRDAYRGTAFSGFLASLNQKVVVFVDEFEKVYSKQKEDDNIDPQSGLLSVMDGTSNSNILFLFTANDKYGVNENMKNRPGRIRYFKDYSGLDEATIVDVCNHLLQDKGKQREIVNIAQKMGELSTDALISLISEVNLYPDISVRELLSDFNLEGESSYYTHSLYKGNKLIRSDDSHINPFMQKQFYLGDDSGVTYMPLASITPSINNDGSIEYKYEGYRLVFKKAVNTREKFGYAYN